MYVNFETTFAQTVVVRDAVPLVIESHHQGRIVVQVEIGGTGGCIHAIAYRQIAAVKGDGSPVYDIESLVTYDIYDGVREHRVAMESIETDGTFDV